MNFVLLPKRCGIFGPSIIYMDFRRIINTMDQHALLLFATNFFYNCLTSNQWEHVTFNHDSRKKDFFLSFFAALALPVNQR